MAKLKTNQVVGWIKERMNVIQEGKNISLKDELGINLMVQGDVTEFPDPKQLFTSCNILLIKPKTTRIADSNVEILDRVDYFFEIYYLRKAGEPEICIKLVEDTEKIAEVISVIEENYERFDDDSLILGATPTDIDYDSDLEGLLKYLEIDVTASKISYQLKAEH